MPLDRELLMCPPSIESERIFPKTVEINVQLGTSDIQIFPLRFSSKTRAKVVHQTRKREDVQVIHISTSANGLLGPLSSGNLISLTMITTKKNETKSIVFFNDTTRRTSSSGKTPYTTNIVRRVDSPNL